MSQKQVIVLRTDLNMRKGKMVAQGAHSSLKAIFDRCSFEWVGDEGDWGEYNQYNGHKFGIFIPLNYENDPLYLWLKNKFTKICVGVSSEKELDDIYKKAQASGLPCSIIVDSGQTEFKGIPTKTAVAIGPWNSEEINKITGGLKLL